MNAKEAWEVTAAKREELRTKFRAEEELEVENILAKIEYAARKGGSFYVHSTSLESWQIAYLSGLGYNVDTKSRSMEDISIISWDMSPKPDIKEIKASKIALWLKGVL